MPSSDSDRLLIGAHTSAAGGAYHALLEGAAIGATTVQLFTANQKQWKGKPLTEEGIEHFQQTLAQTGLQKIMSHAGYLINLGSPDPLLLKKSREAFREELERCTDLGISFVNFHPGSATDGDREACLERIVESLLLMDDLLIDDSTRLIVETTAGQGSAVGFRFEEIAYLIEKTDQKLPMGVCIDTCHVFAAGYDIRSPEAWQKTLAEFDAVIGLHHLCAFHLNDSVQALGSRRDRHANLGEGMIGTEAFRFLMTHPATREIPKYLETPGGCPVWDKEIWMLRAFARGSTHQRGKREK